MDTIIAPPFAANRCKHVSHANDGVQHLLIEAIFCQDTLPVGHDKAQGAAVLYRYSQKKPT